MRVVANIGPIYTILCYPSQAKLLFLIENYVSHDKCLFRMRGVEIIVLLCYPSQAKLHLFSFACILKI